MAQAGRALLRGGLLLAASSFAHPAFAAEPGPADGGGAERERSWYGWQVLVADGVATGLLVTAAATDSRPVSQQELFHTPSSHPACTSFMIERGPAPAPWACASRSLASLVSSGTERSRAVQIMRTRPKEPLAPTSDAPGERLASLLAPPSRQLSTRA